ncbi:hypothetical protein IKF92_03345 [Candidatus Saccharibacteria bacterium]|nr:hypothetical protein [Candidatus Saccharibacteria bacterium]
MDGYKKKSSVGIDGLKTRSAEHVAELRQATSQPSSVTAGRTASSASTSATDRVASNERQAVSHVVTEKNTNESRSKVSEAVTKSSVGSTSGNTITSAKKKKKVSLKKIDTKKLIGVGLLFVAVVAVVVGILVVMTRSHEEPGTGEENVALLPSNYDTTDEENATTKKIMDDMIEIEIGELEQIEDEYGTNSAIPVKVKNISKEKLSIAIEIVAKDEEGNPLDVASLYAEGIEPEQTQLFHAFELSTLTDEQLRKAKLEVHKAYTYETGTEKKEETVEVEVSDDINSGETGNQGGNVINEENREGE